MTITITLTKEEVEEKEREIRIKLGKWQQEMLSIIIDYCCIPTDRIPEFKRKLPSPPELKIL